MLERGEGRGEGGEERGGKRKGEDSGGKGREGGGGGKVKRKHAIGDTKGRVGNWKKMRGGGEEKERGRNS